ncbi:MAG TPA: hypothetical protein VFT22_31365 [Kofleriaceae bacterium]|nr:hypothetical protein [Kofleriaceae bacterium]
MTQLRSLCASIPILAAAACGDNLKPAPAGAPPPATSRAVIVAGDFTPGDPGILSVLDPASGAIQVNAAPAMAVGADPILRRFGHELLIVNRAENNVTILDDRTLALKEQLGTGPDSNPQDVAVAGNKLYVATYGTSGVTVLTRGSTQTTQIDLSADDPDGKPDCSSVYLVGTDLYVSCQLLTSFAPVAPGKVYVVDTRTDTVQTDRTMTLVHKNPFGLFEQFPAGSPNAGDLVIATVEDFKTPGCIERVATRPAPSAAGCLVEDTDLGGFASRVDFEVDGDGQIMWTAVSVPPDYKHANLRAYDMSLRALWEGPLNPDTELINDVVHCPSGQLVLVDGTTAANGLRIYDGTVELTTAPIAVGLGFFSSHGLVCY